MSPDVVVMGPSDIHRELFETMGMPGLFSMASISIEDPPPSTSASGVRRRRKSPKGHSLVIEEEPAVSEACERSEASEAPAPA